MRIDSHQHFWKYDPGQYPWMKEEWPIRRDFLPPDLQPLLQAAGLQASVAVQARQSLEESRWLLSLADQYPDVVGVVGWVDLRSPQVAEPLASLAAHPRFVGVRHVVQDEVDDRFLVGAEFVRGIALLEQFDLVYDLLVFPRQLPTAIELVRRFPRVRFVLDHIAKPSIRAGAMEPWAGWIRDLATAPNVWCKVSGMVTEADWNGWTPADFRPYLDVVTEAFGPGRLMYGSDWPVCELAGSYARVFDLASGYFARFSPQEREAVLGGNAMACYGIPPLP